MCDPFDYQYSVPITYKLSILVIMGHGIGFSLILLSDQSSGKDKYHAIENSMQFIVSLKYTSLLPKMFHSLLSSGKTFTTSEM